MFNELKKKDPKTHIIISIIISNVFLILFFIMIGVMLYLNTITKYEIRTIVYAIIGAILIGCGILWIIGWLLSTVKTVSILKTEQDWDKQSEAVQAKLKFQIATRKYDIVLEKLKRDEPLDASEAILVEEMQKEILETKTQGG